MTSPFIEPFLAIIREVIEHNRDLVVITAEGPGGLSQRLFGSTSLHLMRKCPCPVWVMKPPYKGFSRVLAAVDPDPDDSVRDSLNSTIVEVASTLAVREEGEFHVVHAWIVRGENLLFTRAKVPEAEVRAFLSEQEGKHHRMVEALLENRTTKEVKVHIVKGLADSVIPQIVEREKIDLLVMGTVSRAGVPGLIIGNTAERVLDEVDCSVLTVKPPGFVSPVEL